jgi:acetyl esterase/lipase
LLLSHVITTLHSPSSSILLGGDSAGGNLVLALLGHILHPHPDLNIARIEFKEQDLPIKAALLISPWTKFDHSAPSFKGNGNKDAISVATLNRWARNYLGSAPADAYNQPLTAPEGWWADLRTVVGKVFVVGGGNEIMIDDIILLGEVLRREWGGDRGAVEVAVARGEAHDVVLLDRAIGYKGDELEMEREVQRWLKDNI